MTPVFRDLHDPELTRLLLAGAVGVLPTDTVYGIVSVASLPQSVSRIHAVKRRKGKLGTIVAASASQLEQLGLDGNTLRAVKHLWPNSLSIIIPAGPSLRYLHLDIGSVAARVPAHSALLKLLRRTGPLATTSANLADQPTATTLREAMAIFGDEVDFYVEGGELTGRPPSTIVKITKGGTFETLRAGAVTIDSSGAIV